MTQIIDIRYSLTWLEENTDIVAPYSLAQTALEFTQAEWEAYSWNPPDGIDEPDPAASRKPTWDEMVTGYRHTVLNGHKFLHQYPISQLSKHRTALTDAATINLDGESLYVGAGLDHMTGLLQMVEQANNAGELCPYIVMRDGEQNEKRIHRGSQIRGILKATAARENAVESAHNIVMTEYYAKAKIRDDETQTLDDREAAATAAQEVLDNYSTKLHLLASSGRFAESRWPDRRHSVEETKAYAVEYLEAAAMRKIKDLQGYTTNQGMMLHPSCFDQAKAIEEVAVWLQKGLILINKQNFSSGARGWALWHEEKIEAVEIINTPVFKINQLAPSTNAYPLSKLLVSADHPDDTEIPGEVDIVDIKLTKGKLINGFPKYHSTSGKTKHEAEIQIDPSQPARVVVRARNICGVSRLIINMEPV